MRTTRRTELLERERNLVLQQLLGTSSGSSELSARPKNLQDFFLDLYRNDNSKVGNGKAVEVTEAEGKKLLNALRNGGEDGIDTFLSGLSSHDHAYATALGKDFEWLREEKFSEREDRLKTHFVRFYSDHNKIAKRGAELDVIWGRRLLATLYKGEVDEYLMLLRAKNVEAFEGANSIDIERLQAQQGFEMLAQEIDVSTISGAAQGLFKNRFVRFVRRHYYAERGINLDDRSVVVDLLRKLYSKDLPDFLGGFASLAGVVCTHQHGVLPKTCLGLLSVSESKKKRDFEAHFSENEVAGFFGKIEGLINLDVEVAEKDSVLVTDHSEPVQAANAVGDVNSDTRHYRGTRGRKDAESCISDVEALPLEHDSHQSSGTAAVNRRRLGRQGQGPVKPIPQLGTGETTRAKTRAQTRALEAKQKELPTQDGKLTDPHRASETALGIGVVEREPVQETVQDAFPKVHITDEASSTSDQASSNGPNRRKRKVEQGSVSPPKETAIATPSTTRLTRAMKAKQAVGAEKLHAEISESKTIDSDVVKPVVSTSCAMSDVLVQKDFADNDESEPNNPTLVASRDTPEIRRSERLGHTNESSKPSWASQEQTTSKESSGQRYSLRQRVQKDVVTSGGAQVVKNTSSVAHPRQAKSMTDSNSATVRRGPEMQRDPPPIAPPIESARDRRMSEDIGNLIQMQLEAFMEVDSPPVEEARPDVPPPFDTAAMPPAEDVGMVDSQNTSSMVPEDARIRGVTQKKTRSVLGKLVGNIRGEPKKRSSILGPGPDGGIRRSGRLAKNANKANKSTVTAIEKALKEAESTGGETVLNCDAKDKEAPPLDQQFDPGFYSTPIGNPHEPQIVEETTHLESNNNIMPSRLRNRDGANGTVQRATARPVRRSRRIQTQDDFGKLGKMTDKRIDDRMRARRAQIAARTKAKLGSRREELLYQLISETIKNHLANEISESMPASERLGPAHFSKLPELIAREVRSDPVKLAGYYMATSFLIHRKKIDQDQLPESAKEILQPLQNLLRDKNYQPCKHPDLSCHRMECFEQWYTLCAGHSKRTFKSFATKHGITQKKTLRSKYTGKEYDVNEQFKRKFHANLRLFSAKKADYELLTCLVKTVDIMFSSDSGGEQTRETSVVNAMDVDGQSDLDVQNVAKQREPHTTGRGGRHITVRPRYRPRSRPKYRSVPENGGGGSGSEMVTEVGEDSRQPHEALPTRDQLLEEIATLKAKITQLTSNTTIVQSQIQQNESLEVGKKSVEHEEPAPLETERQTINPGGAQLATVIADLLPCIFVDIREKYELASKTDEVQKALKNQIHREVEYQMRAIDGGAGIYEKYCRFYDILPPLESFLEHEHERTLQGVTIVMQQFFRSLNGEVADAYLREGVTIVMQQFFRSLNGEVADADKMKSGLEYAGLSGDIMLEKEMETFFSVEYRSVASKNTNGSPMYLQAFKEILPLMQSLWKNTEKGRVDLEKKTKECSTLEEELNKSKNQIEQMKDSQKKENRRQSEHPQESQVELQVIKPNADNKGSVELYDVEKPSLLLLRDYLELDLPGEERSKNADQDMKDSLRGLASLSVLSKLHQLKCRPGCPNFEKFARFAVGGGNELEPIYFESCNEAFRNILPVEVSRGKGAIARGLETVAGLQETERVVSLHKKQTKMLTDEKTYLNERYVALEKKSELAEKEFKSTLCSAGLLLGSSLKTEPAGAEFKLEESFLKGGKRADRNVIRCLHTLLSPSCPCGRDDNYWSTLDARTYDQGNFAQCSKQFQASLPKTIEDAIRPEDAAWYNMLSAMTGAAELKKKLQHMESELQRARTREKEDHGAEVKKATRRASLGVIWSIEKHLSLTLKGDNDAKVTENLDNIFSWVRGQDGNIKDGGIPLPVEFDSLSNSEAPDKLLRQLVQVRTLRVSQNQSQEEKKNLIRAWEACFNERYPKKHTWTLSEIRVYITDHKTKIASSEFKSVQPSATKSIETRAPESKDSESKNSQTSANTVAQDVHLKNLEQLRGNYDEAVKQIAVAQEQLKQATEVGDTCHLLLHALSKYLDGSLTQTKDITKHLPRELLASEDHMDELHRILSNWSGKGILKIKQCADTNCKASYLHGLTPSVPTGKDNSTTLLSVAENRKDITVFFSVLKIWKEVTLFKSGLEAKLTKESDAAKERETRLVLASRLLLRRWRSMKDERKKQQLEKRAIRADALVEEELAISTSGRRNDQPQVQEEPPGKDANGSGKQPPIGGPGMVQQILNKVERLIENAQSATWVRMDLKAQNMASTWLYILTMNKTTIKKWKQNSKDDDEQRQVREQARNGGLGPGIVFDCVTNATNGVWKKWDEEDRKNGGLCSADGPVEQKMRRFLAIHLGWQMELANENPENEMEATILNSAGVEEASGKSTREITIETTASLRTTRKWSDDDKTNSKDDDEQRQVREQARNGGLGPGIVFDCVTNATNGVWKKWDEEDRKNGGLCSADGPVEQKMRRFLAIHLGWQMELANENPENEMEATILNSAGVEEASGKSTREITIETTASLRTTRKWSDDDKTVCGSPRDERCAAVGTDTHETISFPSKGTHGEAARIMTIARLANVEWNEKRVRKVCRMARLAGLYCKDFLCCLNEAIPEPGLRVPLAEGDGFVAFERNFKLYGPLVELVKHVRSAKTLQGAIIMTYRGLTTAKKQTAKEIRELNSGNLDEYVLPDGPETDVLLWKMVVEICKQQSQVDAQLKEAHIPTKSKRQVEHFGSLPDSRSGIAAKDSSVADTADEISTSLAVLPLETPRGAAVQRTTNIRPRSEGETVTISIAEYTRMRLELEAREGQFSNQAELIQFYEGRNEYIARDRKACNIYLNHMRKQWNPDCDDKSSDIPITVNPGLRVPLAEGDGFVAFERNFKLYGPLVELAKHVRSAKTLQGAIIMTYRGLTTAKKQTAEEIRELNSGDLDEYVLPDGPETDVLLWKMVVEICKQQSQVDAQLKEAHIPTKSKRQVEHFGSLPDSRSGIAAKDSSVADTADEISTSLAVLPLETPRGAAVQRTTNISPRSEGETVTISIAEYTRMRQELELEAREGQFSNQAELIQFYEGRNEYIARDRKACNIYLNHMRKQWNPDCDDKSSDIPITVNRLQALVETLQSAEDNRMTAMACFVRGSDGEAEGTRRRLTEQMQAAEKKKYGGLQKIGFSELVDVFNTGRWESCALSDDGINYDLPIDERCERMIKWMIFMQGVSGERMKQLEACKAQVRILWRACQLGLGWSPSETREYAGTFDKLAHQGKDGILSPASQLDFLMRFIMDRISQAVDGSAKLGQLDRLHQRRSSGEHAQHHRVVVPGWRSYLGAGCR
ncbi:retrotransposon nucleocapsid protein, partial [Metarhizium hybridum]